MSLVSDLTKFVARNGNSTVDEMLEDFPNQTRDQLMQSLQYAASMGYIRVVRIGTGGNGASTPAVWGPPLPPEPAARPVSFVFDLGRDAEGVKPFPERIPFLKRLGWP